MVKYIHNDKTYVDFEYIKTALEVPKAKAFMLLKRFLVDHTVETVTYQNRILYAEHSIEALLQSTKKEAVVA